MAKTNPTAANSTFAARTRAGQWLCNLTGSELWEDDDGSTRQTLTFLVTEPSGTTYGFFARDLDQARDMFNDSVY